jgi:hypothetical protein
MKKAQTQAMQVQEQTKPKVPLELGAKEVQPGLRSSIHQDLGGLEAEYFEYYPHFSVLTGEVRYGLELPNNE